MADTRVQLEVEEWVRLNRLHRERVRLTSGGVFDFDAVSEDQKIVATTSTGKLAVGKLVKRRWSEELLCSRNLTCTINA